MKNYFKDNVMYSIEKIVTDKEYYNALIYEGVILSNLANINDVETLKTIIEETVDVVVQTKEELIQKR